MSAIAVYDHDEFAPEGYWTFCQYPERLPDNNSSLCAPDDLCRGCIIWAEAALVRGDVPEIGRYLDAIGEAETKAGR